MANALIVFNQVIIMFILAATGYLLARLKLVSADVCRSFSSILLYVVNPSIIIVATARDYNPQEARGFLAALLLSLIIQVAFSLIAMVIIRRKGNQNAGLERFAAVMPNTAYIGIPMTYAVLGLEGVFFIIANIIIFNLILFSYGRFQLEADHAMAEGKPAPRFQLDKRIIPCLINPATIATVIGLILYFAQLSLPTVLMGAAEHFFNLNTALSMLVVGIILSQTDLKSIITDLRCTQISLLRLVVFPALAVLALAAIDLSWLVEDSYILKSAIIIGISGPSAVATSFAAVIYGADSVYGARLVSNASLLCIITMPLIYLLWEVLPKV